MRHRRNGGKAEPVQEPEHEPEHPQAEPGRARVGLEDWLERYQDLPTPLVETARSLADMVDKSPDHSPLWGRYQHALADLVSARQEQDKEAEIEYQDVRAEIKTVQVANHWRAQRYRAATDAGDESEARRWEKLVPIGCAKGNHAFHRYSAGACACLDCGANEDGEW